MPIQQKNDILEEKSKAMAKSEKTITAILTEIVQKYGTDIFRERKQVFGILSDMVTGDARAKERRRIKNALESGAVDILLKAVKDKASSELYINEAVTRLISQTDMAEEFAKETIMTVAEALSLQLPEVNVSVKNEINNETSMEEDTLQKKSSVVSSASVSSSSSSVSDNDKVVTNYEQSAKEKELKAQRTKSYLKERERKAKNRCTIFYISAATFVLSIIMLVISIVFSEPEYKQWLIGIVSGICIFSGISTLWTFPKSSRRLISMNNLLFFGYRSAIFITVVILFFSAVNIVLLKMLGDTDYKLIFHIMLAWFATGGIANTIHAINIQRKKFGEIWRTIAVNVIIVICNVFLFFL